MMGISWTRGLLRSSELQGLMDNAVWRWVTFADADLSKLRMLRTGFVDLSGTALLPDFSDSFVVSYQALADASPDIQSRIRTSAFLAYRLIVDSNEGSDLVVIDEAAFNLVDEPDVIDANERDVILKSLYPLRLSALPVVSV